MLKAGGAAAAVLVVALAMSSSSTAARGAEVGAGLTPGMVPAAWESAVMAAGSTCREIPPAVIAAQIEAESSWNPAAVSPVGAQGLTQFMPGTWAAFGVDANGDGTANPFDPIDAIASQAAYDCHLVEQLRPAVEDGRINATLLEAVLAAYNAGQGPGLAAGGIPANSETPAYVAKIVDRARVYSATGLLAAGPATGYAAALIAAAQSQLGVPYVWGGASPSVGFDCSGLVLWAAYQATDGALRLPHSASQQILGAPIQIPLVSGDTSPLQPGDLVGFDNGDHSRGPFHHIAIYLGNGLMLHAPRTGDVVKITTLQGSPHWSTERWQGARYAP